ncbi:MAG: NAD(P)/FAD-dependent oxidoreductase [Myxococcota bacterium]
MTNSSVNPHVCIIGAGPGGLTVGRALKRAGISFEIIERNKSVGGIWDIDNPGSPMYESAHFISSSQISHFAGWPMPTSYPDYPGHHRILGYIRDFAATEGLMEHVVTSTSVTYARRHEHGWRVNVLDEYGSRGKDFTHLVCASGTTWEPKRPSWPGEFRGEIYHSSKYRAADALAGKRVLVVGAGNSGCDIACDAAQSAQRAYISMRRGYHFVPKHMLGMPSDQFAARTECLPLWLQRRLFEVFLRLYNGDLTTIGLARPDHRVLESHPIVNDQLLHYLRHGDIEAHRDIERLDGNTVHFVDGRTVEVDTIVCATGYHTKTPYLEPGTIPDRGGRPDLFLNILSKNDPTLFATGFVESNSGLFKLFDQKAHIIASAISASRNPSEHDRLRQIVENEDPDTSGGVAYVNSARHANYVNIRAYRRALHRLAKKMRWARFEPSALFPSAPEFRPRALAGAVQPQA